MALQPSISTDNARLERDVQAKPRTYRVRGIDRRFTRSTFLEAISNLFDIAEYDCSLHSIAFDAVPSDSKRDKVATISFTTQPEALREQHEFTVPLTAEGGRTTNVITFDTTFEGFTPVSPYEHEHQTEIDCVFVHGWGGHPIGGFSAPNGTYLWPRDDLPERFPKLRVWLYGYVSALADPDSTVSVYDFADTFRRALRYARGVQNGVNNAKPLIFVVHSLGGWLLQQAVIDMAGSDDLDDKSLLESFTGALYFGVPRQGMNIEAIANLVQDLPSKYTLNMLDEQLGFKLRAKHEDQFKCAFNGRSPTTYLFYEEEKTPTVRKDRETQQWTRDGPAKLLVNQVSATYGGISYELNVGLRKNHSNMVKFGKDDVQYSRILEPLGKLINQALAFISTKAEKEQLQSHDSKPSELSIEEQKFLQTLAFPEMNMRKHDITEPISGTCAWLLQHPIYQTWSETQRGLLWINGNPGAGKSTVMAYAVDVRNTTRPPTMILLSFFFHGRGIDLQRNLMGLYRSILHQLLLRYRVGLRELTDVYKRPTSALGKFGEKWQWNERELQDILKKQLLSAARRQPVQLYVDALDEAGEENAKHLISYFKDLDKSLAADDVQLAILFSCRHYPLMKVGSVPQICIEKENLGDIELYISNKTSEMQATSVSGSEMDPIRLAMLTGASGSFQWVKIILEQISDQHRNEESYSVMLKTVQSTPGDLSSLYRALLQRINDKDRPFSLRLFQWICFARRPLTMSELRMGLVLDIDDVSVDQHQSSDYYVTTNEAMQRRLRYLSAGLAESFIKDVDGSNQRNTEASAQLIHQSVLDFLMQEGFQTLSIGLSPATPFACHSLLLRFCFCCLSMKASKESHCALFLYCSMNWLTHLQLMFGCRTDGDALDTVLFDKKSSLASHISSAMGHWWNEETMMTIAARSDIVGLLRACIARKMDPNATGSDGKTALYIACESLNISSIKYLLCQEDVDVNKVELSGTAPILAFDYREDSAKHIMELLLSRSDIDVNTRDKNGATPWTVAYSGNNNEDIFDMLFLRKDLDANQVLSPIGLPQWRDLPNLDSSQHGYTALHHAVRNEDVDRVSRLLTRGDVNINAQDSVGTTPLAIAYSQASQEIVLLLLSCPTIDISISTMEGLTTLMYAAHSKADTESLRMLLERGSDPNVKDEVGRTALWFATYQNQVDKMQCLIDYGADVNSEPDSGESALHITFHTGNETAMRLLINAGADPYMVAALAMHFLDQTVASINSCLSIEREKKRTAIKLYISLILQSSSLTRTGLLVELDDALRRMHRMNDSAKGAYSPLDMAFELDIPALAAFMHENQDIWAEQTLHSIDNQHVAGKAYLHEACSKDLVKWVEMRLEYCIDPSVQECKRMSSFYAAAQTDSDLPAMPILNANDLDGATALHDASWQHCFRCMQVLINAGADLDRQDKLGRTALHHVYRPERSNVMSRWSDYQDVKDQKEYLTIKKCLEVLIDAGASLNIQDWEGATVLHYASVTSHLAWTEALLSNSTDTNAQDIKGRTPLHYAAIFGNQIYVRKLLDFGANPGIRDHDEMTAIDYITLYGHSFLLHQFGAAVPP